MTRKHGLHAGSKKSPETICLQAFLYGTGDLLRTDDLILTLLYIAKEQQGSSTFVKALIDNHYQFSIMGIDMRNAFRG